MVVLKPHPLICSRRNERANETMTHNKGACCVDGVSCTESKVRDSV
jgi:hypothetical protein